MNQASTFLPASFEPQLAKLCLELEQSDIKSFSSPQTDPYWPKWDNLWWKLTFLLETQQIKRLSQQVILDFANLISTHYLTRFPISESELPAECDPFRHVLCHCALGTAVQILQAADIDPWQQWPWLNDWFIKNQLPDGGYNCDEKVYTHSKRSSLVSSIPMLEALLAQPKLSPELQQVLHSGVKSLLKRKLFQSSLGQVIDPLWLAPIFPRFYHYDILRAMKLVIQWKVKYNQPLSIEDIGPAFEQLEQRLSSNILGSQGWYPRQDKSRNWSELKQEWHFGENVSLFPLLADFIAGKHGKAILEAEFLALKKTLSL